MFNNNAENVIVLFAPNARGNFVKNCLTLTNNTADATYKNTLIHDRFNIYKKALSTNHADEPAHIDKHNNYSTERILNADHASRYIHCGHIFELPQYDKIETMQFDNKIFVVITTDQGIYSDFEFIDRFTKMKNWYNLPYIDILNKEKFAQHCYNIDNHVHIDLLSDYYNTYYITSIKITKEIYNIIYDT